MSISTWWLWVPNNSMSKQPQELKLRTNAFALRIDGDVDRLSMDGRSFGLSGRGNCLVVSFPGPPLRVSPGKRSLQTSQAL
jgi:hypothetical protein